MERLKITEIETSQRSSLKIWKRLSFKRTPSRALEMNADAWSQGQIRSKVWMAETLEKHFEGHGPFVIWILGGWYAVSAFLLFSRGNLKVRRLCSFDLDEEANRQARLLNNAWSFEPSLFFTYEQDCEKLDFRSGKFGPAPDLVINTAMEHFSVQWIHGVPEGTFLCLQATNMKHPEHIYGSSSLEEFKKSLASHVEIQFAGEKEFDYPDLKFSRYMIIGQRRKSP